ncbi:MAG: hypothetical protein SO369_03780 [Treponema sp.]|nr:hypothetical protein [Treponema sp.]
MVTGEPYPAPSRLPLPSTVQLCHGAVPPDGRLLEDEGVRAGGAPALRPADA